MSTFLSTSGRCYTTTICIIKLEFSLHTNNQCPDVLNATDQTSGDLNVTVS